MDSPFSDESIQGFAPRCAIPMFHMNSSSVFFFLFCQTGKRLQGKKKINESILTNDKFKKKKMM